MSTGSLRVHAVTDEISYSLVLTQRFDGDDQDLIDSAGGTGFTHLQVTLSAADDIVRLSLWPITSPGLSAIDAGGGQDLLIVDERGAPASWVDITDPNGFPPVPTEPFFYTQVRLVGFERLAFIGGTGNDSVAGGADRDTLIGGEGDDTFRAVGGDDFIDAGAGNDVVYDISWEDSVSGGTGNDIVGLDLRTADVGVRLAPGESPSHLTGFEQFAGWMTRYDDFVQMGPLVGNLHGGAGNDTLVIDYSDVDEQYLIFDLAIKRTAGMATLDYEPFETNFALLTGWEHFGVNGSRYSDRINTGRGKDTIYGGGGYDVIHPGGGNDLVYGGDYRDQILGSRRLGEADTIYGGAGNDEILFANVQTEIHGGAGYDLLSHLSLKALGHGLNLSTDAAQWLDGIESLDKARLTDHADTIEIDLDGLSFTAINGGLGDDLVRLDASSFSTAISVRSGGGAFAVSHVAGDIIVTAASGSQFERFALTGSRGDDQLSGLYRDDTIIGQRGADTLHGMNGNDLLDGGGAQDIFVGGAGDDRIITGDGPDVLVYFGTETSGRDVVEDFRPDIDFIVFAEETKPTGLKVLTAGEDRIVLWSTGQITLTGTAGEKIQIFADTTILQWL